MLGKVLILCLAVAQTPRVAMQPPKVTTQIPRTQESEAWDYRKERAVLVVEIVNPNTREGPTVGARAVYVDPYGQTFIVRWEDGRPMMVQPGMLVRIKGRVIPPSV